MFHYFHCELRRLTDLMVALAHAHAHAHTHRTHHGRYTAANDVGASSEADLAASLEGLRLPPVDAASLQGTSHVYRGSYVLKHWSASGH